MINDKLSFLLLRLTIGTSMFVHGLVRLPKLAGFSNWMVGKFANSMLPAGVVLPFSYALPIIEFAVGVLVLIGLFTKQALTLGAVVMIVLLFGSGIIEDWGAFPTQLIHAFFFVILLSNLHHNYYAFDRIVRKK